MSTLLDMAEAPDPLAGLPEPPPGVDPDAVRGALRMLLDLAEQLPQDRQADGFAALLGEMDDVHSAVQRGEDVDVAIVLHDDASTSRVSRERVCAIDAVSPAWRAARAKRFTRPAARRTPGPRRRPRPAHRRVRATARGPDEPEPASPAPELRLWRHPVYGACTPNLLRVLVGGRA